MNWSRPLNTRTDNNVALLDQKSREMEAKLGKP